MAITVTMPQMGESVVEGTLEQPATGEPVVVEAEPINPVQPSEFDLAKHGIREA